MSAEIVGEVLEGFALGEITQAEVDAYVAASGDDNPLHRDAELARSVGLAGIPVPGMLIMAQLARCARGWPRAGKVTKLSARFVSPVIVGNGVEIGGRVVAMDDATGEAILRLTAKHRGKIAVLGEARVSLTGG
jgi:acyl dehydratase